MEDNEKVIEETQEPTQPDAIEPEAEVEVAGEEPVKPKQEQPKPENKNFRALREEKERIERERNEMQKKLAEIEASRNPKPQEPEDDDFNFNPEDLVEGKHLSKVAKKIKSLEKQLYEYEQKSSVMTAEARLKAEYPDFDKIVSKDNIEVLKLTYPELAQTIDSNPDLYVKAKSAYTIIKKLGIQPDENNYEEAHEVAKKNLGKPRPASSAQAGDSPLSMANAFAGGLSDDMKKKLYQEMLEAKNNKGFY